MFNQQFTRKTQGDREVQLCNYETNYCKIYKHHYNVSCLKHTYMSRLMVVSQAAKKQQHASVSSGIFDHYNELVTSTAALKFANGITNLPQ